METPLLSIIIPVYNSEKTISRAILSVLEQASIDLELIVVNDGSTDESASIVKRFAELDARIKLYSQPNLGVSVARNFGIKEAKGKYLTFLDADDYYPENGLSKITNTLDERTQLVIFGYDMVYETKTVECSPPMRSSLTFSKHEDFHEYCLLLIDNEIINAPWNKVYLTSYLHEHNIMFPPEMDMGEDLKFNLEVLRDVQFVKILPEPLVKYTIKKGAGLVARFRENRLQLRFKLMTELKEMLAYWGKLDKTEAMIDAMLIKDIMAFFMDFYKSNCQYSKAKKLEMTKAVLNQDDIKTLIMKQHQYDFITKFIHTILVSANCSLILFLAKILNMGRGFR